MWVQAQAINKILEDSLANKAGKSWIPSQKPLENPKEAELQSPLTSLPQAGELRNLRLRSAPLLPHPGGSGQFSTGSRVPLLFMPEARMGSPPFGAFSCLTRGIRLTMSLTFLSWSEEWEGRVKDSP